MFRHAIKIEYLGTAYAGWQTQPNQRTVQSEIEQALTTICRQPCKITGAGRTDTGVHASGQVAHFDTQIELDPAKVLRSLNGILEEDIAILKLQKVSNNFHARYDAEERAYGYYVTDVKSALLGRMTSLVSRDISWAGMNEAAKILVRRDDFSSFCRTQSETTNRVCDVRRAQWSQLSDGRWKFTIRGDRFLHGMVRAIVGTLLQVGAGMRNPTDLVTILNSRDRTTAGPAAPAHGLILEHVVYPHEFD